jgi:hypothetical protein
VTTGISALALAGVVSLMTAKSTLVLAVWGVVGPLFGGISGYDFKNGRKDAG